jgi:hypothetical protein
VLWWCLGGNAGESDRDLVQHEPPILKSVRWQSLADNYQNVFVDAAGRAWFFCAKPSYLPPAKWAYLVCPELPDKTIQMPGLNEPLGFDGQNRFWDIGKRGLCCTDVHRNRFFERHSVGAIDPLKSPWTDQADLLPFAPVMFEHSSGRLYFADSEGVHILDGDVWFLLHRRTLGCQRT